MNAHSTPNMERHESLRFLAAYFDTRSNQEFTAPHNIEYLRLDEFNARQLTGSIFTEIANALGITKRTFGALSHTLGLTQYDIHHVGCSCNGEVVMGSEVAKRLRTLIT